MVVAVSSQKTQNEDVYVCGWGECVFNVFNNVIFQDKTLIKCKWGCVQFNI